METQQPRKKKFLHYLIIGLFVLALSFAYQLAPERSPAINNMALFASPKTDKIEIGAFVGVNPPTLNTIETFEKLAGRNLYSMMWYEGWDEHDQPGFPRSKLSAIDAQKENYVLHLTWEPAVNLKAIFNGVYDTYISTYARDTKDWEGEIRLRFAHEMIQDNIQNNGKEYYKWQDQPKEYIKAFRHVHEIFSKAGANNVQFVWCPNNFPADVNILKQYYPGPDYVDWLCMDGYNWGNRDGKTGWPEWLWFDDIFGNIYHSFIDHPEIFGEKPIMIGEFSSCESSSNDLTGQNKAEWIKNAFERLASPDYKRIKSFHWFHINKECDWRVNSSDSAKNAFKAALKNKRFTSRD